MVTVIIISIIMSILAIGIIAINTSQVKSSEQVKRDLVAEMFARMVFWEIQANYLNNFNIVNQIQRTIDSTTYTADISVGTGTPPLPLNIVVSY